MSILNINRLGFVLCFFFSGTIISAAQDQQLESRPLIKFVNEYVIPAKLEVEETVVGGLSGIDFYNGQYYAICDDEQLPRVYIMDISITDQGIEGITIASVIHLRDYENRNYTGKLIDPEDIRVHPHDGNLVWVSEGKVKKGEGPKIVLSSMDGIEKQTITLDTWNIPVERKKGWGPRHNKTLEGLCLSNNGQSIWTAMEMPLKQDGKKPKLKDGKYPIRISQFNKGDGKLISQHAYMLDSIARPSLVPEGKALNGLTAILTYDKIGFLTLERSYSEGYMDGGNEVKIYFTSIDESSDIKDVTSLKEVEYTPMTKELLFDFSTIKDSLVNGVVDNIEGICFGPDLPNGNKSLLVISDDNFQKYGPQKTQVILLEIE
ncbi:MAG: hypothetical protein ACI8XB_000759 [Patiriisocius sp.]|jgi:hypothetical protein